MLRTSHLGFVSSLTRSSKYFKDARVNSSEDGVVMTKRSRDTRVKLADIKEMETVGKIAFAPALDRMRARKGRWYE
jgi:hypothetical protein